MPRPKRQRCLRFRPSVHYFKPQGIPMRELEEVILEPDELEALKLHDVDKLPQLEAAAQMKISQPTFARILDRAYHKLAEGVIKGKAIRIGKS